jgi:putative transcriptional regulator
MIVYNKFNRLLEEKGISKTELQKKLKISPSTMSNFGKNQYVALSVIDKICTELKCQPGDIMEWVENEDDLKKIELQRQIEALQKELTELENKSK